MNKNIIETVVELSSSRNKNLFKNLEGKIKHLPIIAVGKEGESHSKPVETGEVTFPEKVELKKGYVGNGNYANMPTRIKAEKKSLFYIMGRTGDNRLIGTQDIEDATCFSPTCRIIDNAIDYKKISDYKYIPD
jgi:hypothetical protein